MAIFKNTLINDTGFLALPVGNTAQRPSSPANGYTRFNNSTNTIEFWSSNSWIDFTSNSVFNLNVEYLVIAGGGSGGGSVGGGGGAGGYLTGNANCMVGTAYTVTVGAGGAAPAAQIKGTAGSNSVFNTQTAVGGGGGAASTSSGGTQSATSGGSGGGGSAYIQPITFRDAQSAGTTTTGTSSVVVNKPTGLAVGDLMVVGLIVNNNTTTGSWGPVTYPSGFTEVVGIPTLSYSYNKTVVAYKIADANDVAASNFTFTYTESGGPYRLAAILAAYYNVNQTTPIDVTTLGQFNSTGSTSAPAPSITPSNGQPKRLLNFYSGGAGLTAVDGINWTAPASQTERAEVEPGTVAYSSIMLADEAYESASATGTRTATISQSIGSMTVSMLLRSNDAPTGTSGGAATSGQGNSGGNGNANPNSSSTGAGGGGAGAAGSTPSNNNVGGNGGAGLASSITGSSVTRGGGGGGAGGTTGGTGGSGGGGNGGVGTSAGSSGNVNTGGGGGGGWAFSGGNASSGGSGVVILKIPDTKTATFSAGITSSNATVSGYKVYTVTAGTGTVTFS